MTEFPSADFKKEGDLTQDPTKLTFKSANELLVKF